MRPSFALLSLLILAPTAYAEDSLLDIDLGDFDLDEASVEEVAQKVSEQLVAADVQLPSSAQLLG